MKEKRYIHRWMLAPVLACLLLATASCSKDVAETEAVPSPGGTYLTIVTRGINTTDENEYEDYVETLRVIAFKGGELALNTLLGADDIPNTEGTVDKVILENTDKLKVGNGGGAYTFYFIANEEGHVTDDGSISLTEALTQTNVTETGLENMRVQFTKDEIGIPTDKKMLMSVKQTVYITEGQDQTIEIELIRALAKAQLALKLADGNTTVLKVESVTLKGSIPNSYYLIPKNEIQSTLTSSVSSINIKEDEEGILFDTDASISPKPFYISETVYLPEQSYAENNAMHYEINIDGTTFTNAVIADGTDPDNIVYNIIRNTAYTTIGTYDPRKEVLSTFNLLVVPWAEENIDVPPFE